MSALKTSSSDVLRSQFKGIRVEFGSLVKFRDAPAFEMVMRLNQRHKGKLVTAILTGECSENSSRPKEENKTNSDGIFDNSGVETKAVFVPETYEEFLDAEMQKWLDPFRGRGDDAEKRKRGREERDDSSSSSISDNIADDVSDEDLGYSSSSSA